MISFSLRGLLVFEAGGWACAYEVLSFDSEDLRAAGLIRASLTAAATQIGPYDVLIAGQALARGLVLITNNLKEFARVNGLRVEDWSVARA
jgi:tRNA(fMet)-specific endonuclease VapC